MQARYHEPGSPFFASECAADQDAGLVDEQPVRHAFDPDELGEDPFALTALDPALERAAKRLLRPVDMLKNAATATVALQCVDNPSENAPVISTLHPACVAR